MELRQLRRPRQILIRTVVAAIGFRTLFYSQFIRTWHGTKNIARCVLTFDDEFHIIHCMQLRKSTIGKLADVLIRLGEAAVIGAVATFFVKDFPLWQSVLGVVVGIVLIVLGLYTNDFTESKGAQ